MTDSSWGPVTDTRTLGDVVVSGAKQWPDHPALVIDRVPITYAEADDRSNRTAAALHALGVRHGDRVALLVENCIEIADVWFACGKTGAIEVALNTAYRGDYLRHQLLNCLPRVLVIAAEYVDRLPDLELEGLAAVLVRGSLDGLPETLLGAPVLPVTHLLDGDPETLPSAEVSYADPLMIVYTGGTTGPSKGVVLPHRAVINAADTSFRNRGGREGDVVYSPLPLFHLNAHMVTVLGPMLHGGTGVLDQRFSVSQFWDRVDEVGADHIAILGAMLTMVWNLPPSARDAQHGVRVLIGAPISADMREQWESRYDLKVSQGFALTECTPICSRPIWLDSPPGSSGIPVESVEVRLFDDSDHEVPVGSVGEVCVRPRQPSVMFTEYFRNPEATLAVWRNGWFHTGDLGRFDENGFFYFEDRKKDYLRRRGENVSSFEVERTVRGFGGIADVAAIGVPSEFTEDDCLVAVVPAPGVTIEPFELIRYCARNMPFFAVPRYVRLVEELPKSPVGKILKYVLREQGTTGAFDLEAHGYRVNREGLVPTR
ncbi:ATP-dependent acyl-CoA ligase [Sporichthya brevicatena]|uniref:ATP-dependent acyl-CoA ligase n=1 Tax=Sporichthya brevicatena TaxID=171442 RepID=A0ABN1GQG2_9ACTN